jgi:hypothetical protein
MQMYMHYKTATVYEVLTDLAMIEATKDRAVVYRSRHDDPGVVNTAQIWIRPFAEFHALVEVEGGRFVPRFAHVGETSDSYAPAEQASVSK